MESENPLLPVEYAIHQKWYVRPNRVTRESKFLNRQRVPIDVDLTIHPLASDRIIILYPGKNETADGPEGIYQRIAKQMQDERLGAVVRSGNPSLEHFLPSAYLRKMLNLIQKQKLLISGSLTPELLLMGYSSGASAVASIVHDYPAISRILLIAPSGDMPKNLVSSGLSRFQGSVTIAVGEQDEVVGAKAGQIYYDLARNAVRKELFLIPECDHYFTGRKNKKIFQELPFYAFAKGIQPEFMPPTYYSHNII